jgi:hypothetical protein
MGKEEKRIEKDMSFYEMKKRIEKENEMNKTRSMLFVFHHTQFHLHGAE